ncbi:MAG: UbiA family prenyltransferase [Firmicutes bacterium]|nr:UbiA family prenyltransferase [Bacillota bacterium]
MTVHQFIRVSRPPTLMATVVPLAVGGATAFMHPAAFSLWGWLDILFIAFLLQIGANMLNEYFDYRRGLDDIHSMGIGGIIVSGEVSAPSVLRTAIATYAIAFVLGILLVIYRGPILLFMGLGGIIAGFLYTGGPWPISSTPFGEVFVALIMGPLEVLATQVAADGFITTTAWVVSWPVGISVATILLANNLRDRVKDAQHHRRTLPIVFGWKAGYWILWSMVLSIFIWVSAAVFLKYLPVTALLTWLALPLAVVSLKKLYNPQNLKLAVPITGRLHMVTGILLSLGLLL